MKTAIITSHSSLFLQLKEDFSHSSDVFLSSEMTNPEAYERIVLCEACQSISREIRTGDILVPVSFLHTQKEAAFLTNYERYEDLDFTAFGLRMGAIHLSWTPENLTEEEQNALQQTYECDGWSTQDIRSQVESLMRAGKEVAVICIVDRMGQETLVLEKGSEWAKRVSAIVAYTLDTRKTPELETVAEEDDEG